MAVAIIVFPVKPEQDVGEIGGHHQRGVHGNQQILPGLESELAGMAVEEEKSISLDAENAYGPVDPAAFQEVPLADIPEEARAIGTQLRVEGYDGPIRVHEIQQRVLRRREVATDLLPKPGRGTG